MVGKSFDALQESPHHLDIVKFLSVMRCGLRGTNMSIFPQDHVVNHMILLVSHMKINIGKNPKPQ